MGSRKAIRIVIDTNVIVSALLFGGRPGKLVELWHNGNVQPYGSKSIIEEYIRVLTYPKFKLKEDEINYLIYKEILPYFEIVDVTDSPELGIVEDPSDEKFLHCAVKIRAAGIVSGDDHLLKLKSYQNIPILSVSQFLKSMV